MSRPRLDAPIERKSVAEQVATRIVDIVRDGGLKPGDLLPPERDLAQTLGVSRPSVREAIRGLAILGIVRTRQGGGANITSLDADALLGPIQFYLSLEDMNVAELYQARELIESDVARRAAVLMDETELAVAAAILAEQEATLGDPEAFRASDFAFHSALWAGARNGFLKRIGESLNVIGLEFRKTASETPGVLEQSLADHAELLAALQARDADAAAGAAARHMANVYRSTTQQRRSQ